MDFLETLKKLETSNSNNILSSLKSQKREIEEQMHIVRVLTAGKKLEELRVNDFFKKYSLDKIEISANYDSDTDQYYIRYAVLDNIDSPIVKDIREKLNPIIYSIMHFASSDLSEEMNYGKNCNVYIDKDLKHNFLSALLSEKLYAVVQYAQLDKNVKDKNQTENTKLKI